MFFNKKKPKIDPKIRFQNRQFNQKLQQARTFKRTAKPIPDGRFSKFLISVGLGGSFRQILFAFCVLGILYLVYFPNFLTLKQIEVEGLPNEDRSVIEAIIRDDIAQVPFYNPQRNLLFLSKDRVSRILQDYPLVNSIEKIDKQFKGQTLKISVLPKHETFLVKSDNKLFTLYNDGFLKEEMNFEQPKWDVPHTSKLIRVDILAKINHTPEKSFLSESTTSYIREQAHLLQGITGSRLAYFKIPLSDQVSPLPPEAEVETLSEEVSLDNTNEPVTEPVSTAETEPVAVPVEVKPLSEVNTPIVLEELNIIMQKGDNADRTFTVLIDPKEKAQNLVERLRLLLSQTSADRYDRLDYIDLRVSDRAYICLKQTVCSK